MEIYFTYEVWQSDKPYYDLARTIALNISLSPHTDELDAFMKYMLETFGWPVTVERQGDQFVVYTIKRYILVRKVVMHLT